jgi:hypothetical protein
MAGFVAHGIRHAGGGGLDIKVSNHIALRPIEADYYLAHPTSFVSGETANRNNFRDAASAPCLGNNE